MLPTKPKAAPTQHSPTRLAWEMEQGLLVWAPDTAFSQIPRKPDRLLKKPPSFSCHPQLAFLVSLLGSARDCDGGEVGWEEQEALRVSLQAGLPPPSPRAQLASPPPAGQLSKLQSVDLSHREVRPNMP